MNKSILNVMFLVDDCIERNKIVNCPNTFQKPVHQSNFSLNPPSPLEMIEDFLDSTIFQIQNFTTYKTSSFVPLCT